MNIKLCLFDRNGALYNQFHNMSMMGNGDGDGNGDFIF